MECLLVVKGRERRVEEDERRKVWQHIIWGLWDKNS